MLVMDVDLVCLAFFFFFFMFCGGYSPNRPLFLFFNVARERGEISLSLGNKTWVCKRVRFIQMNV